MDVLNLLFHTLWESKVCCVAVAEGGVAANLRHLNHVKDRTQGGLLHPGYVRVPHVGGSVADASYAQDLRVALHMVAEWERVQRPKTMREGYLLVDADVLPAEEYHLPLQQCRPDEVDHLVRLRLLEVDIVNDRAYGDGQVFESEPELAGALLQPRADGTPPHAIVLPAQAQGRSVGPKQFEVQLSTLMDLRRLFQPPQGQCLFALVALVVEPGGPLHVHGIVFAHRTGPGRDDPRTDAA
mmetsp:Transcript_22655/g.51774  ORF Transcript_22655/g.51774 Transcript_22655/m.51774 type:complete len:240 (-) Transcript_22655:24-743(-)